VPRNDGTLKDDSIYRRHSFIITSRYDSARCVVESPEVMTRSVVPEWLIYPINVAGD